MTHHARSVLLVLLSVAILGGVANADAPKEITTDKNKPVLLGNLVNTPADCGSNPGPVPLPRLRERPSKGGVGLQIVAVDVPASDACPARKIPAIAFFYTPNTDYIGLDSVQVEFESTDSRTSPLIFSITVRASENK